MASQTALTCNHYKAGYIKNSRKILQPKNNEKEKNAPDLGQKGRNRVRFGCRGGVQPVRTGGETRNPNQNAPDSNATHEKRKPAETQSFCRFCGRGRRTWSRLPPRSGLDAARRAAGPHGTRFWSGCGNSAQGTGKGQRCPVSNASPGEDGAGLVLWEIFRAKTGEKEREIPEKT